jgi:hypothetical protein
MANATDPFEVGAIIQHAIETDQPRLRYPVSWGGPEILGRRETMNDAEWIALGALESDDAYYAEFERMFGIRIAP